MTNKGDMEYGGEIKVTKTIKMAEIIKIADPKCSGECRYCVFGSSVGRSSKHVT